MTRDDVIRMGHEAGIVLYNGDDKSLIVWLMPSEEKFLKFAALVADAEREACAQICENLPTALKVAAYEFGYQANEPHAKNYAAAIRARTP